jgi:cell division protein FtsI/penicillin-binding protein 2
MKKVKKKIAIVFLIFISVILAGIFKFNILLNLDNYNIDRDKIKEKQNSEKINKRGEYCDENGKRFAKPEDAVRYGLKYFEFGATYCPEYKMDSS